MKIQIDTGNKIIKVEEKVKVIELYDFLHKIFTYDELKQYSLDVNTIINWSNPITIDPYKPWRWPYYNVKYDTINNSAQDSLNKYYDESKGITYNFEVTCQH